MFYFKFVEAVEDEFSVWENIYLVQAVDEESALLDAKLIAKRDEGDDQGSLVWNGKRATRVFLGIRKVIKPVLGTNEELHGGIELTYSEFKVSSKRDLGRLARGKPVVVEYVE
jgi:hypothetical protein